MIPTLPVGGASDTLFSQPLAISPDGKVVYVVHESSFSLSVSAIDVKTHSIIATISLGVSPGVNLSFITFSPVWAKCFGY
ncbi:YncE family protein [Bacillus sp. SCS-151]|uniref:YncE family protein n=1 Tax=Nanhaiella sioensis TaxID=3115293 RepID=UPI00397DF935